MAHKDRVLENVQSLSNITDSVVTKIDKNILSIAARKMFDLMGNAEYADYTDLQSNATVVNEITNESWTFESSSDEGRMLKNLELAEAYCVLHYLSISLRKVDIDTFMTQLESWGEGSIRPIDVEKILSYGDRYLLEARSLIKIYSGDTGSVGLFAI